MSTTELTSAPHGADVGISVSRLIVTRRGAADATYRAIGYLDRITVPDQIPAYEFRYLAAHAVTPTFVPLIGFSDLHRRYRSSRLFPSFADRVISAKRPDRPQYLAALDLDTDADAWEILSASGGHREGDPIELISMPTFDPATGATTACFLSHGVRHCTAEASAAITNLQPGAPLSLVPAPGNTVNSRAIRIMDGELGFGFVPEPLLDYVHSVMTTGTCDLRVVRSNPAETHPHLRLLLRLTGSCDTFVFDGPEWAVADTTD